jgi:serine/threonine protein kinase/WD40 repeat protein
MESLPEKIGKYEVIAELGRGAMGTVYKARDPILQREVALKTMSEALLVDEEMRERFYREARSAAQLQHPNIVTIYELGEVEGKPFIAMELLQGCDLAETMDERRIIRLEDKVRLLVQICRGLDFAHKRGVIHRDVKPGNIQVLPDGTIKVLDFGIAWRAGSTLKTKTGLVMGTPTYMAPEQITGSPVDHRADMWAVGIISYELLSGKRPFDSDTVPTLIYHIVHAPPPTLDARALGLPQATVDVVRRALGKSPDERFRDLNEMGDAFQKAFGTPVADTALTEEARERSYTRNAGLARTLLARGQPARALEAARRAQALEPSKPEMAELIARIEELLRTQAEEPTLAASPPPKVSTDTKVDAEKWIDEARLALTGGNRTEALRIVEDVLTIDPDFGPAVELREILDKPAAPGRARTGPHRTYTSAEIRIKRASTFREQVTFGEPLGIQAVAISPQENLVAVGGLDGAIRLWDLETRSKLATLRSEMHRRTGHEGLVTSLAISGDGGVLASGHLDGAIHVWTLDAGQEFKVRLGHDASVGAIAFSPDGKALASGGLDATVKIWEVDALRLGDARRRMHRQPAGVSSLVYARDGAVIVTGHTNRVLRVQDAATGRLTATLRGHQAGISCSTVAPDGNLLASGGQDRMVRIFDLQRRAEVVVLEGHKKTVSSIAFFPDCEQVTTVAMENSLVVWDLQKGTPSATLWGAADESFANVVVLGKGEQIACALADGRIRIWVAA